MTDDPASHPSPLGRAQQLMRWAAEQVVRSQRLTEEAHEACARAASLSVESAMVVDEMRFRQMAPRKVDRLP
jgi:hypothetical protein